MRTTLALGALLALLAPLAAQRSWIVDAYGRGDFRDLPQAVAAASPRDTLLVRPGDYSAFTAPKALRIVGVGASPAEVRIRAAASGSTVIDIASPAAGTFLLARVRVAFDVGQQGLDITSGTVNVLLHDCEIIGTPGFSAAEGAAITARYATRLLCLTACTVRGRPAILATNANVHVSASRLFGAGGIQVSEGAGWGASPAVTATQSWVVLARSSATGGGLVPPYQGWGSAPALRVTTNSTLWLGGRPSDVIRSLVGDGRLQPAVNATTSVVIRDPSVTLVPNGPGIDEIVGATRIDRRRVITTWAYGSASWINVEVGCRAGDPFVVGFDAPRSPVPSPYGQLGLDLGSAAFSGVVYPTAELTRFSFRVPSLLSLLGTPLLAQSVGWNATIPGIDLSNIACVVVN